MTVEAPTIFFRWVREAVFENSFLLDFLDIERRFILDPFQVVEHDEKFDQHWLVSPELLTSSIYSSGEKRQADGLATGLGAF